MGYTELKADLRDVIGNAWPEVVENGIYQPAEIITVPFERKAKTELPFAVVSVDLRAMSDYGGANDVEGGPISIYYVAADSLDGEGLTDRLLSLRAALWPLGLTAGQVMEFPSISCSMETIAEFAYFVNAQRPFKCGKVIAQVIMGEGH